MGGTHAGLAPRHPPWFRAPARAGRRPAFQAVPAIAPSAIRHLICWGVRAETGAIPAIRVFAAAALRAAVPAGGRRSKPSPPWRRRLYAISSVGRVHAETGGIPAIGVFAAAALRAAVPAGGRRSKPSPPWRRRLYAISSVGGYMPRREASRRLESSPPRPCGPLCRPEAGVPSRPRHGAIGSTRSRAHPRCRHPVAAAFHGKMRAG